MQDPAGDNAGHGTSASTWGRVIRIAVMAGREQIDQRVVQERELGFRGARCPQGVELGDVD